MLALLSLSPGEAEQIIADQRRTETETEINDNSLVVWDQDGIRVVSLREEILVNGDGTVGQEGERGPVEASVVSVSGRPGAMVMQEGWRLGNVIVEAELRERDVVSVQQSGESTRAEEDHSHPI